MFRKNSPSLVILNQLLQGKVKLTLHLGEGGNELEFAQ